MYRKRTPKTRLRETHALGLTIRPSPRCQRRHVWCIARAVKLSLPTFCAISLRMTSGSEAHTDCVMTGAAISWSASASWFSSVCSSSSKASGPVRSSSGLCWNASASDATVRDVVATSASAGEIPASLFEGGSRVGLPALESPMALLRCLATARARSAFIDIRVDMEKGKRDETEYVEKRRTWKKRRRGGNCCLLTKNKRLRALDGVS